MEQEELPVYILKKDGEEVKRFGDYYDLMYWMHKNHSYSLDWATKYEGYSIDEI